MSNYNFVYVNEDGSVREVTVLEKLYLQTKYSGGDGDRPYIKSKYSEKDGWGKLSGFCYRTAIPGSREIKRIENTVRKEQIEREITRIRKMGYEIDLTGIEI